MANSTNSIFKYGTVVGVDDSSDGDRVKVHVKGVDSANYSLDEIPYAFPLLPKTFFVKPKIGETVFVIVQDGSYEGDRFWIGPIISQPHKIEYDSVSALSLLKSGLIAPDQAPSTDPDNIGVQFDADDIGLQGRGTTDVVVKPNEIRIRAGKTLDFRKLNRVNPSYMQIKYDTENNEGSINVVADNINLLSHKSIDKFNLVDPLDLINSEEYANIIKKAHRLPFGDVLIDFMGIFMKAFTTHVHAYNGLPPDLSQIELKNLLAYQLDKILSNNIRIN